MDAEAEPGLGAPATGEAAIHTLIALRWWRQALPVAPGKAPTFTDPAGAGDLKPAAPERTCGTEAHRDTRGHMTAFRS